MITPHIEQLEQARLREIIEEYEAKGYELLHLDGEKLPASLAPFPVRVIVGNKTENVVVEVSAQSNMPTKTYLPALVQSINAMQGWRLELIIVSQEEEELTDVGAHLLTREEIYARLVRVHTLLEALEFDAAMLLCWATIEGAVRIVAHEAQIDLAECTPAAMLKKLYAWGLFTRDDLDILQHALVFRNTLVHGYQGALLEPKFVEHLIEIVEHLVTEHKNAHQEA